MIQPPLRNLIEPPLDRARLQAVWRRVESRRARPARRWSARQLALAGAVGLVLGILVMWLRSSEPSPLRIVGPGSLAALTSDGAARLVQLSDGSSLLLGQNTRLELTENSGHAVSWRLPRGRVELEVRPGGPRRWIIRTEQASIEVVGTHFVVEKSVTGTNVSVSRGEVLVRGANVSGRVRSLVAGESIVVPVETTSFVATPSPATPPPADHSSSPSAPSSASRVSARPPDGPARVPATNPGRVTTPRPQAPAPSVVARSSSTAVAEVSPSAAAPPPGAAALLQAADRARRAGRLEEAAALLRQAASDGDHRQQAAIASFTLGRLYAGPLARPADAAHAFDRAIGLGLPQALVEDTLLRQAQAYDAAGDLDAARDVAAGYLARFPDGRHRQRMRRWIAAPAAPAR